MTQEQQAALARKVEQWVAEAAKETEAATGMTFAAFAEQFNKRQ